MNSLQLLILLAICFKGVLANTEKLIFIAPGQLQVPTEHPTLEDLRLQTLSPDQWSIRTQLDAEFPSNFSPRGKASWILLQDLETGQRYEVRVCWAATQPTSFHMQEFEIPVVFQTPELINSLADYADMAIQRALKEYPESEVPAIAEQARERESSMLLLQIHSAADYYTKNKMMMDQVPGVFVDIILDPYVFNVFPRSMLPTVGYIALLAFGSWYLSRFISSQLHGIVQADDQEEKELSSQAKDRKGQGTTYQVGELKSRLNTAQLDMQKEKKKKS